MNVSLTPALEKFVADKVQSGRYTSASEVVGKRCGFWNNTKSLARHS